MKYETENNAPREAVLMVCRRWKHHSKFSSYRPLADGVGNVCGLMHGHLPVLTTFSAFALKAAIERYQPTHIHAISAEKHLATLAAVRKGFKGVISATFHQPADNLKYMNKVPPDTLDGAIAVGPSQIATIAQRFPRAMVQFLPHGVNTDWFRPNATVQKERVAICVGSHRRDYHTLQEAAKLLHGRHSGITVRAVYPSARPGKFNEIPVAEMTHIEHLTDLDEEGLRRAYQEASILALPLISATANNSLLEGMACGLPVVTTNLPDVRAYCPEKDTVFCARGDGAMLADAIESVMNEAPRLASMATASRAAAEAISWPAIRSQFAAWSRALLRAKGLDE